MTSIVHQIAGWRFDPREPVLRDGVQERWIEDRAARALDLLCRRRGDVVSKEELIAEVWGGRAVSGNSVSIVIGSLRRALGDDPRDPVHLLTVARRGYRLVEEDVPASLSNRKGVARVASARQAIFFLAACVAATAAVLLQHPPASAVAVAVAAPRNATGMPSLAPVAASLLPVVRDGVGRLRDVRLLDGGSRVAPRVIVRSDLILWNGAPELAITATDARTGSIIWTGFAAGPAAQLARHVTARLQALQGRLPS